MSRAYGDSGRFYREIKLIKICKAKGCRADFRPRYGSLSAKIGLCYTHRKVWYKEFYKKYCAEYERTPERKKMKFIVWKKWVGKHLEWRRKQALASYHRRKNEPANKKRKHRATRQKIPL